MLIDNEELISILGSFNPWWKNEPIQGLPDWERALFKELYTWVKNPPTPRAIMLSGARQIGKTTLVLQSISKLLKENTPPENILYATFDHPILKLAGIEKVLTAWRTLQPKKEGKEFIFLDEAQFIKDWGTWVKHQVDFHKSTRQIVFTGSALPLVKAGQESGVGRWHTLQLTTLSFFEYLRITKTELPKLPTPDTLQEVFKWSDAELTQVRDTTSEYIPHFHQYLLLGGFPQTTLTRDIYQAQKLIREDIIDKVLKRDMTALFGVRLITELESVFLYLCLHDGAIAHIQTMCKELELKRPTVDSFIDLLESTHLIYRLRPLGYGKEVLKGKAKLYLSDPAIAPAVFLKGQSYLENPTALGTLAESAVLKHCHCASLQNNIKLSYWREKETHEVDIVVESEGKTIPIEVKYRSPISEKDLLGLNLFYKKKSATHGYLITKFYSDLKKVSNPFPILQIPAALFCYWLGEKELNHHTPQSPF